MNFKLNLFHKNTIGSYYVDIVTEKSKYHICLNITKDGNLGCTISHKKASYNFGLDGIKNWVDSVKKINPENDMTESNKLKTRIVNYIRDTILNYTIYELNDVVDDNIIKKITQDIRKIVNRAIVIYHENSMYDSYKRYLTKLSEKMSYHWCEWYRVIPIDGSIYNHDITNLVVVKTIENDILDIINKTFKNHNYVELQALSSRQRTRESEDKDVPWVD